MSRRQAILGGIQTYVRVLCEQKQIGVDVLSDVMCMPPAAVMKWISDPTSQLSELALLLALVYAETYPVLLWILERRGESQGHHTIAKLLNEGIDLGHGTSVPPTPSVVTYRRKPYL
jgi:hypothetical protein